MSQQLPLAFADFLVFLNHIALLILSTHVLALRQSGVRDRSWGWAALTFALLAFAHAPELLLTAGVYYPWLDGVWSLTLLAAFIGAISFVGSGTGFLRQLVGDAQRKAMLIAAGAGIVGIAGFGGVSVEAAVVVVWVAGFGMARTLAGLTRADGQPLKRMRGAALSLVILGVLMVAGVFLLRQGDTFTAAWILVARAVAGYLVMFHVGGYAVRSSQDTAGDSASRPLKTAKLLLGMLLVGALVLGALVTEVVGQRGAERLTSELELRANTVAAALRADFEGIAPGDFAALASRQEDIRSTLAAVIGSRGDIAHAYVLDVSGSVPGVVVQASSSGSVGDAAAVPDAQALQRIDELTSGESMVSGLSARGTWYVTYVPVAFDRAGEVTAVLGLDIPADLLAAARAEYRLIGIALALSISALVIGFYVVLQMTRSVAAAVHRSDRRFRRVFEHAPEAILVVDVEVHEVLDSNPFAEALLGYQTEQLRHMLIEDIVEGETGALCTAATSGALEPETRACRCRTSDGRLIEVEVTAVPMSFHGRNAVMLFMRDVSARNEADRLREKHAEFNSLVTEISRAFVNVTASSIDALIDEALVWIGNFADVDRAYVFEFEGPDYMRNTFEWVNSGIPSHKGQFSRTSVTDYPSMTGRIFAGRDVYLPDVRTAREIVDQERQRLERGGIKSLLCVPMAVGGHSVGFLGFDSIRSIKEWTEDDIVLLRMVADIIANAQARTSSEDSLHKASRAIEQSPVAVIITDKDGHIEYVNPKFTEVTGYSRDEVMGENPRILKSGLTPEETYPQMWDALLAGGTWSGDFVNWRKDRTPYWGQATISAMRDEQGEITHFVGVQQDVTEQKEQQAALERAKEQADAANRAKSEFLATMSHEIRTPMNAIIGMAELLRDTELNTQQERYVEIFQRAGESLLDLINSVLDLSKIEADKLELEQAPFDLCEVVETAGSVVGMRSAEKGLELLYRMTPDMPRAVIGDSARLRQVLMNLLGNAVKFTDEGQVLLTVSHDPDRAGHGDLLFSVSDTGIGIPEDKLASVFESFTQADSSTTRKYGGTGLGLTISRRIVELMGGRMWVESEEGKGTTFFFTAPFKVAERAVQRSMSEQYTDLTGRRILVVDDNETNRLIVSELVQTWGVESVEAEDAESGLLKLWDAAKSGNPFDAVVLDHQMPGMDGFEFIEKLRAGAHASDSAVVMLSSDARGRDGATIRRLGLIDYLLKPLRRAELHDALLACVSNSWKQPLPEPRPVRTAVEGVAPEEQPARILLVEDSDDNRFLIRNYMSKSPYVIVEATDGLDAVEAITSASAPFDLVLMDMQMPVMDGYEATRRIREWEVANRQPRTRIVALTAYALNDEIQRSIDAGCDDHLTKPIKKKTLLSAIAAHTEGVISDVQ